MNELKLDYLLLELKYLVDTFTTFIGDDNDYYMEKIKGMNIDDVMDSVDYDNLLDYISNLDPEDVLKNFRDRDIIEYVANNMSVDDVVCFNY